MPSRFKGKRLHIGRWGARRERQLLYFLWAGYSPKEFADFSAISDKGLRKSLGRLRAAGHPIPHQGWGWKIKRIKELYSQLSSTPGWTKIIAERVGSTPGSVRQIAYQVRKRAE